MITAEEYRERRHALMAEFEHEVRKWLSEAYCEQLAREIPFVLDGVVCPERWFQSGNTFRPLIVLKEVSFNIECVSELPGRIRECGNQRRIEFVEFPFEDVRNGTCRQWQRIARLVKALETIHDGASKCDYSQIDMRFMPGGEIYTGDIEVYMANRERTANPVYSAIVDRMAVLELKKVASGKNARSELSRAAGYYSEHAKQFQHLLLRQIELIDPTVIVCLGRDGGSCISSYLAEAKKLTSSRIWIDGYHHAYSSNKNFFDGPLAEYKRMLKSTKGQ